MRATLEQMIEESGADELMKIIARCEHALDVGIVSFGLISSARADPQSSLYEPNEGGRH